MKTFARDGEVCELCGPVKFGTVLHTVASGQKRCMDCALQAKMPAGDGGVVETRKHLYAAGNVTVLDAARAGLHPVTRWVARCEPHQKDAPAVTLADARGLASDSSQFCDACRELRWGLPVGGRVCVARPLTTHELNVKGRVGKLLGYVPPLGYARVDLDPLAGEGTTPMRILLPPDSLERVSS